MQLPRRMSLGGKVMGSTSALFSNYKHYEMSFDFQFLGKYEVLVKSGITLAASLVMNIEELNLILRVLSGSIAIPVGILTLIKLIRDLKKKTNAK